MTETNPIFALSVGEIAAQIPGAPAVFRRFDISFCCHGDSSLAEAAKRGDHDLEQLKAALDALDPNAAPEAPQETGALIDHIQTRYHDVHRRQIPELIELSTRVEAVHANKPDVPAGLADILRQVWGEMEVHMKKEELLFFPAMRKAAKDQTPQQLEDLRHEHDNHGAMLDKIAKLTDNYTAPKNACRTWQALYAGAAQFRADLNQHIHLENNILFPRFEAPTPG